MISSSRTSGTASTAAPQQPDRGGLARRVQHGEQVAEPLGAGDPGGVHGEGGQPQLLCAVAQPGHPQPGGLQPGQPPPPDSDRISGVVTFPACRVTPGDQASPGERRGAHSAATW